MSRLYTITGNLLAETTASYAGVEPGQTHRAAEESFQVGGKGINVARMTGRLGWNVTAVCFPGGDTGGRSLQWLATQGFSTRAFPQKAETRAGWVVRCGGVETTFLGQDRAMEETAWLEAMAFLRRVLTTGDVLAICGSIPGWRPALAQPLMEVLDEVRGRVFTGLDTYGAPLADLFKLPWDLVRLNRLEVEPLMAKGESVAEFLGGVAAVSQRWVITDGAGPVVARGESGEVWQSRPPPVDVVSAVGSGDVMFAGLLWGLSQKGWTMRKAVDVSLRLAAANAASPGVADFDIGRALQADGASGG
jgi:1-phosphofructokinase